MELTRKFLIIPLLIVAASVLLWFVNDYFMLYAINTVYNNTDSSCSFSIMTFNVNAVDSTNFVVDVQDQLINLIIAEKPDILCFQELGTNNFYELKPRLDSIYGSCDEFNGGNRILRRYFYSKFPIQNIRSYTCNEDFDQDCFNEEEKFEIEKCKKRLAVKSAEFEIEPGRWVEVFSGHLRSSAYSTARRSMEENATWIEGLPLYWHNYRIGKIVRDYESLNVSKFINEERAAGKTVVIAGDLNDWCGSDCLNMLMGNGLKDAWWDGGNGFGWTYFGWNLRLRLDHILFSEELELTEVKVVDSNLSDHKPLIAKFRL